MSYMAALPCKNQKTLCLMWQPFAVRIKDLMSFYNGPTFTVLVKLRIVCLGLLLY